MRGRRWATVPCVNRSLLGALAAALITLLVTATALAAVQEISDADDDVATAAGKRLDIRKVELAQGNGDTWVDVTVDDEAFNEFDAIWVGFDTDFDGAGDYVARLRGFSDADPNGVLEIAPDTSATATCLQMGTPTKSVTPVAPLAGADPGTQILPLRFLTSDIGGAENYRWAVYAQNDSNGAGASTWDYAPDATNPNPGRPASGDDECGDGRGVVTNWAIPIKLADGVVHGTAPSTGNPTPDPQPDPGAGEQPSAPQPQPQPTIPNPVFYIRTGGPKEMPDLRPRSRNCRQGCTEEEARALLIDAGLGNARIVFDRSSTVTPRRFRRYTDDGEVFGQSIAPGTELSVPDMAAQRFLYRKPPTITLTVFKDRDLELDCNEKDLEARLEGRSWPGSTYGRGADRVRGAQDLLEKDLRCDWRIDRYVKKAGIDTPQIGRAEVRGSKKRVTLTIEIPKTTELAIELADRPGDPRFRGNDVAGLDIVDGAMPVTGVKGYGGFVVKVYYLGIAPTNEVAGAVVDVYDGNGELTANAVTDANGEAALFGYFRQAGNDGYITATLPIGNQGLSLDGQQPLRVKEGAERYRTDIGRWIEKQNGTYRTIRVNGRRATARAALVCRGVDANGQLFYIDNLQGLMDSIRQNFRNAQSAASPEGRKFWLDGVFHALDTAVRAGATDQQAFADLVRDINIGPATVGNGTRSQGTCNLSQAEIDTIFPSQNGAAIQKAKGFNLANGPLPTISGAGQSRLPDGGFIRNAIDKNATIIATDGASLIGQAGGNVISTGGLNLIGQAGGNLIGQAGGNLVSDNGLGLIGDNGGG